VIRSVHRLSFMFLGPNRVRKPNLTRRWLGSVSIVIQGDHPDRYERNYIEKHSVFAPSFGARLAMWL